MIRLIALLMTLMACAGCQSSMIRLKPAIQNEGEVYVYLQPLSPDGGRLGFTVDRLSAVTSAGLETPLTVKLPELNAGVVNRQRMLGKGLLPPGDYDGFSVTFKSARLNRAEGEAALLLPDKPVRVDCRFSIGSRKAVLVNLAFKYEQSVRDGYLFTPSFSADIPGRPLAGLAGYITNHGSDTITVFDKKSGEAVEVIETGSRPAGIALDQLQRKAYVVLSGEDAVEVIDLYAEYGFSKIKLNPGDEPREAALTPDGRYLLVTNPGSNTVSIIDPAALLEVARVRVGNGPGSVLMDGAGRRAYVFNTLADSISVIDIGNRAVTGTITTESAPVNGAFNRKGDKLLVFHEFSPYLLLIDPRTLSVQGRVYVGMGIGALKVDPLSDLVYVGKKMDGGVEIYDPFSLLPGGFIAGSGGVNRIAIDGELNNLLLLHGDRKTVEIINLISKEATAEIDAGESPFKAAVNGER